ncbi:MAG: hypothetical protein QWI73_06945 [Alphaproteobacteria bacterium]|nr:hypothetical protein [Alphaproteobacteria bacterium]
MKKLFTIVLCLLSFLSAFNTLPLVYRFLCPSEVTKRNAFNDFTCGIERAIRVCSTERYNCNDPNVLKVSPKYFGEPKCTKILRYKDLCIYYNIAESYGRDREYHIQFAVTSLESEETGKIVVKLTSSQISIQSYGELTEDSFYSFINIVEKIVIEVGTRYGSLDSRQYRRIKENLADN